MSLEVEEGEDVEYRSTRPDDEGGRVRFRARYRPAGPARRTEPGILEHWLTERCCLYAASRRRLYRAGIHHAPWRLQPAEAEIRANTMTEPLRIELDDRPALVHLARRLDVVGWLPEPAGSDRGRRR